MKYLHVSSRLLPAPALGWRWLAVAMFAAAVLGLCAADARAHRLGESYLIVSITDQGLVGRVELPPAELEMALSDGQAGDGILTPQEFQLMAPRIADYVAPRLELAASGRPYTLRFAEPEFIYKDKGVPFVRIGFSVEEAGPAPRELSVRYDLLFDIDPLHRALVIVESNAAASEENKEEAASLIISKDDTEQSLDLTRSPGSSQFLAYVEHGMFHIAIGFDHILFLVALLLAAPLIRTQGAWQPRDSFREALWYVTGIVTLFTLSHSITLALAALGLVVLPGALVEAVIAITVVIAALHNLFPLPSTLR